MQPEMRQKRSIDATGLRDRIRVLGRAEEVKVFTSPPEGKTNISLHFYLMSIQYKAANTLNVIQKQLLIYIFKTKL